MINLNSKYIAIDTETTGLNPWDRFHPSRPFAFSFQDSKGNSEYHRWDVDPLTRNIILNTKSYNRIQDILSSNSAKVFYNANFDLRMLEFSGFKISGKIHDAMILMHVITGGSELSYELKPLSKKYLGIEDDDQNALIVSVNKGRRFGKKKGWCLSKKSNKEDYWLGDPKLCKTYALRDVERTMLLFLLGKKKIETDSDSVEVYKREMRLTPIVRRMEDRGVRVFRKQLVILKDFYQKYMKTQRILADQHGGKGLNFNSTPQKVKIFYTIRKHKITKRTKKGNPSLAGDVLVHLAKRDPLAKAILEHNAAKHAITGFITPYNKFRVRDKEKQWILHPNFRQCGPITGRFSCSDPNLMQVADSKGVKNKAEITLRPRECFGPRKKHIWYLPDFSQMEVWAFAFLAKEEFMIKTLLSGEDIHGAMAKQAYGDEPDFKKNYDVHRTRAKFMTWCKLYGGGVRAIAEQLLIPENEAREMSEKYDSRFPGLQRYIKRTSNLAERQGWVQNPYGRKYFIDPHFGYRAVNYMIQGTCADIMKTAMIRVHKILKKYSPSSHMLLTLHDELVVEVRIDENCSGLMEKIICAMQKDHSELIDIPVPLPVDMAIVKKRWSEPQGLCRTHLKNKEKCTIC